ncbi:ABC transporter permease [Streptomyces sp. NPDC050610]|uniref:ABC transporter permease n=1 Tax=Streptomyces sp. NPDC050610 TaxID=3157097 RepID=UPI003442544E
MSTLAGTRPKNSHLTGTGPLTRLALRRDRIMLPVWVYALSVAVVSTGLSLKKLYGTAAERADFAHSMSANSSLRALYGPVLGDSIGALTAWRMMSFGAALTGVMSLLIVVRHTREEEESGRQELLSSAGVGRRAPLTAALSTALAANTLVAALIAAGLPAIGQGAAGALALGLAVGATGMVFAGVAAVAAQLTESARLAKGITAAVIGVAFTVRAAGDASAVRGRSPLVWLSPLGWPEQVRPYAGDRWWVLLLPLALTAATVLGAYALTARRDLGAGLLATRPGPAGAGTALRGPYGLAWRLQRGTLLGWATGLVFAGAVFGAVAHGAADIVGDNKGTLELFERLGGGHGKAGITDAFLATITGMLGLTAALYATGSVLRLTGEETGGRAEPLLACAVGRLRWAAGHLVIAFAGAVAVLAAGGLAMGLSYGATAHDIGGQLPRVLAAALAQTPAVWALTGVTVLLAGALPRLAAAAWGLVGAALAIGWLGPMVDAPQWVMDLSPFGHLPKLPGPVGSAGPFLWLTALAAVLTAAGLYGLRRRDVG